MRIPRESSIDSRRVQLNTKAQRDPVSLQRALLIDPCLREPYQTRIELDIRAEYPGIIYKYIDLRNV